MTLLKTIFDISTSEALIRRIGLLEEHRKAEWGRMNVYQMVKHNVYWNEWILGKEERSYKQALLGKIFGKWALRRMIIDEKPLDKNIPTSTQFQVKEEKGDWASAIDQWITLVNDYQQFHNPAFVHDFFGTMTKEQIGILVYKHTDHHLRQFGV